MKKVLIVTYYWPPSGGGGVQRWLKFSKYLPEYGWQPIIFTPEDPDFTIKDHSLAKDISAETEVLNFPIWEPYGLFDMITGRTGKKNRQQGVVEGPRKTILSRLATWIRGNLMIPDPKIFWVNPSIKFLKSYILENSIDHIITTGPPHSMHLIGLRLKKKTGVKWIADFRDPWVRWDIMREFHLSWPAWQAHKRLESKVMQHADLVLTVSDTWAEEIKSDHRRDVEVITNGFDPMDFENGSANSIDNKFVISHSGLINSFRNPSGLWAALRELCDEKPDISQLLQIEFCGMIDGKVLEDIQSDKILGPKFKFRDYLSHLDILKIYKSSSVLLLLLNDTENAKGHLPGKLFEYMASNRHILAIGDKEGDASKILRETGTGIACNTNDVHDIKKALSAFFTHFKNGNFPNSVSIKGYSRKALTKELVNVLEQL